MKKGFKPRPQTMRSCNRRHNNKQENQPSKSRGTNCGVGIALLLVLTLGLSSGCSLKGVATDRFAEVLSDIGKTFASDNDPDLIRAAVPFSLKVMEGLLAQNPRHLGLLLACSQGFAQYSFAYVMEDAEEEEVRDAQKAAELQARGASLYLRARDYAIRAIEIRHPGFMKRLTENPQGAVSILEPLDVPYIYWAAASWAGAVGAAVNRPDLMVDLPLIEALADRGLLLDEAFGRGALHVLLIPLEMHRGSVAGNAEERARNHFTRAVELTEGRDCSVFVTFAESVALAKQDKREFKTLLERALAVDPNTRPESRLANIIMQRRATRLLSRMDTLFVE